MTVFVLFMMFIGLLGKMAHQSLPLPKINAYYLPVFIFCINYHWQCINVCMEMHW